MSKSGEYLKGTKRLQIINKWLRGIEDPFYEVYPTRKDGKYILKKRKEPLEVSDDEDADNEDNIKRDAERDNTKREQDERDSKRKNNAEIVKLLSNGPNESNKLFIERIKKLHLRNISKIQ